MLHNEGSLVFTSVNIAQGQTPTRLSLGGIDGNGVRQLIAIGSGTTLLGADPLLILRSVLSETCIADLDGNGVVEIDDSMALIGQWSNDCKCGLECTADLDGNSVIDIEDVVMLIGLGGNC